MAQLGTFVSLLPQIEAVLKDKGETLPRPVYDQSLSGTGGAASVDSAPSKTKDAKQNFEETSEDED